MTRSSRLLPILLALFALHGCVVYEPLPGAYPTTQERFDRSWSAALGAMADQGVMITSQDRGAGVIQGIGGGATLTATVQTLPDGRIQVKFNSTTTGGGDSGLIQRLSQSYDRRMGR